MSLSPSTACGTVELQTFQQHVLKTMSSDVRLDGRSRQALRSVDVHRNVAEGCLASAMVALGGSTAQCAVKAAFGPPMPETPHLGRVEVHVETPFAPPFMESTQECRRMLALFLREVLHATLDLAALCVVPGEACWVLYVDVTVLGFDGSLRSLCLHAAVAALQRMVLPRARLPDGSYSTTTSWGYDVIGVLPIAVTSGLVMGAPVVDTTAAEECVSDALVTIVVDGHQVAAAPTLLYVGHHGGHPCTNKVLELMFKAVCAGVPLMMHAMAS